MSESQKIVLLTGRSGSGKSTIAKFLALKYGFTRMSIAGAIKQIIAEVFHWSLDSMYDERKDEPLEYNVFWFPGTASHVERLMGIPPQSLDRKFRTFRSRREAMQVIGTDIIREGFDLEFHLNNLLGKMIAPRVVVDDVRFLNELLFWPQALSIGLTRGLTMEATHSSEGCVAECVRRSNWIIDNEHMSEEESLLVVSAGVLEFLGFPDCVPF
jgi:chloramphenicol 3-O-phosphotransferase